MSKEGSKHSASFKAEVASEPIMGDEPVAQIASRHEVHPGQIRAWKVVVLEAASEGDGGPGESFSARCPTTRPAGNQRI